MLFFSPAIVPVDDDVVVVGININISISISITAVALYGFHRRRGRARRCEQRRELALLIARGGGRERKLPYRSTADR